MINVAIVGIGNISGAHLSAFQGLSERCKVVALCDTTPSKAEAKARAVGLDQVDIVGHHQELLERDDIHLVSICTPPASHAEITVDSLNAGKNVVVEKPMAPSLRECDAMLEAQANSGKLLSVISQNRFRDDISILKEVTDSGLLGPISHLHVDSAWWRGVPYYDLHWRGTWASEGGGPTLNHAIHHIDLMLWLMGSPQAVMAMMTNAWHDNAEVEDLSVALLRYQRAIAQLTSSVVHHGESQQIIIQGRDASVAQPWRVHAEDSQPNGFPTPEGNKQLAEKLEALARDHQPLHLTGHGGQLLDVLDAIDGGTTPNVTGQDGRNTIEVVTAIYRAAIEGAQVELPIEPSSPYYSTTGILDNAPRYFPKSRSVDHQDGSITVSGSKDRLG